MAKPGRDGTYVGETTTVDGTVWIWMGTSWQDAQREEPDAVPFHEPRFDE